MARPWMFCSPRRWKCAPNRASVADRSSVGRAGFTLVEMLVAVALTLLLMLAVVTVFGQLSRGVREARAMGDLAARLRNVRLKLAEDLRSATALRAQVVPPVSHRESLGFFEYVEGPSPRPLSGAGLRPVDESGNYDPSVGDVDDVLCFTIHSQELLTLPLPGGGTVSSHYAEVMWFMWGNKLVRRVRLIMPGTTVNVSGTVATKASLRELALRHMRMLHFPPPTPPAPPPWPTFILSSDQAAWTSALNSQGDLWNGNVQQMPYPGPFTTDVILDNVLSFDVKIWDPEAPVFVVSPGGGQPPIAVSPGSPLPVPGGPSGPNGPNLYASTLTNWVGAGMPNNWGAGPVARGAFVDLFYARRLWSGSAATVFHLSWFSGPGYGVLGQRAIQGMPAVYDTWSDWYERDGLDQDGDSLVDEGTNELHDPNNAPPAPGPGVDPHLQNTPEADEPAEQEAPPPYRHPVKAIQVKIRVFDPATQQVREVTLVQSF